ncbi:MAG: glutathione peroxidase [Rhodovarius sp.]|nr:glutathione peroxidase [Rhodovarius sp.]MCX7931286.1 glutathione peroxidase [Rhodovarius sp.]
MRLEDVPLITLSGEEQRLSDYRGRALLVVNVASKCGFTPQYRGLEELHRRFAPRGFAVLGFPCNQFGGQEPGDAEEIRQFCSTRYEVTFPLFAKTEVNGPHAHPLFRQLKMAAPGLFGSQAIKWNFTKFLIDPSWRVVRRYAPTVAPAAIARDIEAVLPA